MNEVGAVTTPGHLGGNFVYMCVYVNEIGFVERSMPTCSNAFFFFLADNFFSLISSSLPLLFFIIQIGSFFL